ncbi:biliverdin-producing heme oxygenase [Microvirga terrae]|uniref:Biliverdin-producing heme oxygenase n=1 Tax=Microvirga terrae TaxID=2740529 RepID=A0ABY5RRV1_9HYPH|nr:MULTISPECIES: biliverdin-producing heme oxygenase [Microvirga]MBQ0820868.1 biliverdin-producing heme oxygenase [Microvirga sp. HBU67558]UVF19960.1 biliverdin-producing heme oxygenase [Microvirga terrae]
MTLLERLKIETRQAHDRIETAIDLDRRIASREAYRDLLIRFYGFHKAWESEAAERAPDRAFFDSRRKTDLLARDLEALGLKSGDIIRLPQCRPLMPLPAPEAVLGSMYVVEGSTLGGAIIARQVEHRLGFTADTGCAYFRSYGRHVAAMWKSFGAMLQEASSPEADDLIVGAAQDTFTVMHDWLCETP